MSPDPVEVVVAELRAALGSLDGAIFALTNLPLPEALELRLEVRSLRGLLAGALRRARALDRGTTFPYLVDGAPDRPD